MISKNPPGLILENEDQVARNELTRVLDAADPLVRGFSRLPKDVKPIFRHVKKRGRKPADFERFRDYWLFNDRVREVFDAVDPTAFEYLAVDITYDDGSPTVHAWLCDVVRLLDALDEEQSDVSISEGSRKQHNLAGARRIVFRDEAVGAAHVFRIAYAAGAVVCDDVMRHACKTAQLRSVMFRPAIYKNTYR